MVKESQLNVKKLLMGWPEGENVGTQEAPAQEEAPTGSHKRSNTV